MARSTSSNPLSDALDKRIQAVVDQTLEDAVREAVRTMVREELSQALGAVATQAAPAAAPVAPSGRRGRPPGRAATAGVGRTAAAGRAARGRGATATAAGGKLCAVVGCNRPFRSQGYCAAHYQAARKYDWPMPAPATFEAPERPSRGRPRKEESKA